MPRFMRTAAKVSVPSPSALAGGLDGVGVLAAGGVGQRVHQPVERGALVLVEQVTIGQQRRLGGQRQALGLDTGFGQRAAVHVAFGLGEAFAQHVRHLVVAQAVARLDDDGGFDTAALLAGADGQQAVGVHLEGHADARRAGGHRRNAPQLETRERTAVADQLALALHDVDGHRGLAVLEGGEFLRLGGRQRRVALDHALDQPAHRLQPERQRRHVEQQHLAVRRVARQRIGLDRGAKGHDFVRVHVDQRLAATERRHRRAHDRHARRAADHHSALHLVRRHLGVAQHALHQRQGAASQVIGGGFEFGAGDGLRQCDAVVERGLDGGRIGVRQGLLGSPGRREHDALVVGVQGVERGQTGAGQQPLRQVHVVVIAAERRVAAYRDHLEHAAGQAQQRDIEGAAA